MTVNNLYKQIECISNTIISIQYTNDDLLTFRVSQAQKGEIIKSKDQGFYLSFEVYNNTYTLNRKHFNQMSNRELDELFNQLRVDGSQFL